MNEIPHGHSRLRSMYHRREGPTSLPLNSPAHPGMSPSSLSYVYFLFIFLSSRCNNKSISPTDTSDISLFFAPGVPSDSQLQGACPRVHSRRFGAGEAGGPGRRLGEGGLRHAKDQGKLYESVQLTLVMQPSCAMTGANNFSDAAIMCDNRCCCVECDSGEGRACSHATPRRVSRPVQTRSRGFILSFFFRLQKQHQHQQQQQ